MPTVNDIARVAGVSLATVDRVLNGRSGVRAPTIEKVNKAIVELGYIRDTAAANLARRRLYRLRFLLPDSDNEFIRALRDEVVAQGAQLAHQRTQVDHELLPAFNPTALCKTLDALDAATTDGVAVLGPDTPVVRDAVARARNRGIGVVTLVSDLPGSERSHFVGIDNLAAGRTAAEIIGRFANGDGPVLVITGSQLSRDHEDRRTGFETVMRERFPGIKVLPSVEGQDDPERVAAMMPELFETYPDLCGIYASAGGAQGLVRFLEETGPYPGLTTVAHELTASTAPALRRGTIDALINQDSGHLVRSAIRLLRATAERTPIDHTQERIRIDIYLRENLPPDTALRGPEF